MQKTLNKKIVSLLIFAAVASILLTIFRTYLLINCVEPDTGFYMVGTSAGKYFNIAVGVLSAVLLAGAVMLAKTKAPAELKSESTMVVFASSLCGFLFATVFLYGLYTIISGSMGDTSSTTLKNMFSAQNAFLWIEILLCIPCMFNFFCICSKERRDRNALQTVLSLSPAVFFAVRTVQTFTNVKSQINVSQRSLTLILLCAAMLFFVCETRFIIPGYVSENPKKNDTALSLSKYFVTGVFTFAFTLFTVLPYLAVSAFWVYEANFLIMDVLDACVGLYALTRMISVARCN